MAQFRQPPTPTALSDFRPTIGGAGNAFNAIADSMNAVYGVLEPAALKELARRGTEDASAVAGDQMVGGESMPIADSGNTNWAGAIRQVESSGNYQAKGPTTKSGDRAYGAYQVMGANIGPWTEKHFGTRLTAEEFLANPAAQDAVFNGEFGGYLKIGTPKDAISRWFTGRPYSEGAGRSDGYNTGQQYVDKVLGAAGQAGPAAAPVMMREADGALVKRLRSPLDPKFAEVYNAAANAAYLSDVMVKGSADIMSLSGQFPDDPQGFMQAAAAYATDMAKKAPEAFKADIAGALKDEVDRRYLGMVAETQRNIQERALNSTGALVDKYASDYASAVATGDADAIGAARANLESSLRTQEALPGSTWTPEQSANRITDAEAAGQAAIAQQAEKQAAAYKDQLKTVISAADAGMTSEYDGILNDPAVRAAQPELWAEASAKRAVQNNMPGFMALSPSEQALIVNQMKGTPITDPWQIELVKMSEQAAADKTKTVDAAKKAASDAVQGSVKSALQSALGFAKGYKATVDERNATWADQLKVVAKAAADGKASPYEALLANPSVRMTHPELWSEAAAKVEFRNNTPAFNALTPDQQTASVAALKSVPVTQAWQMDIPKAAADLAAKSAGAWEDDPIAQANAVLPNKPPAIPPFDPANPALFQAGLQARVAYAKALQAQGYTDAFIPLSTDEATALGVAMGKTQSPESRAMMAGMVVAAAGPDAVRIFDQIKSDDPSTLYTGKMMARGGDPSVAVQIMRGQAMLDDGLMQPPSKAITMGSISPDIATALAAVPNAPEADILGAATAIYAATAPRNTDPSSEIAQKYMADAVQKALGQSKNNRGLLTGGVQNIGSAPTLLPPGVAGDDVSAGLAKGFAQIGPSGVGGAGGLAAPTPSNVSAGFWTRAGAVSEPMLGGVPLRSDQLRYVTIQPASGNRYSLSLLIGGQVVDARDAQGNTFTFDINKLVGK